jgi:DNA-binding NarL/FixJ family response regulator
MAANDLRLLVIGTGGLPDGIVRALEASGVRVSAQVAHVAHAAQADHADVVLLDDEHALRDFIESRGDDDLVPIVVRSSEPDVAGELRESGAPGWAVVGRDSTADELAAAVVAAARGFAVRKVPPSRSAARPATRGSTPELDRLTDREREVLALVSEGLPNKAIAARLGISEHTVKFHLSSIFSKLGVASRTEAVRRGVRAGLIEL